MIALYENIKIAIYSLWENKIRSMLTVLGVVIGVFAIITIIAIGTGLRSDILGQVVDLGADVLDVVPGDLGAGIGSAVGLQEPFDSDDVENLKKKADLVEDVVEMYQFAGAFEFGETKLQGFVIGTNPAFFRVRGQKTIAGEIFTDSDSYERRKVAVIGSKTAEELYRNPETAINQQIRVNGTDFKVVGVLESENLGFGAFNMDMAVYLPSYTVEQYFSSVGIMEIFMKVIDEDKLDEAQKQVEIVIKETRGDKDFTVLGQEALLSLVTNITGVVTSALAGLASVSLLVGGIGIMNIMLVSVTERTKEIGIRKAIGATDNHILQQFLIEAVILCLVGGGLGLLVATGLSAFITFYYNFPTLITLQTVLGALGFSLIVGVIFGTAPALKAAKKDPVDALRYE